MRGGLACILVVWAGCKAQLGEPRIGIDDDATVDAAASEPGTLGAWGTPVKVPNASTTVAEDDGTLSANELELVFAAADAADGGRKHLYVITRSSRQSTTWSAPVRLPFAVTGTTEQTPRLSEDNLTLYFASNRTGTTGGLDIWRVTRAAVGGTWSTTPVLVAGINSAQDEKWLALCDGDRYLLISGRGGTSEDVYQGVLGGAAPTAVAALNTPQGESGTFLSKDCRTAYFASTRSGTNQIYTTTRSAPGEAWVAPVVVSDFASIGGGQEDPWIAADGRTFVFVSDASGNKDVYLSTR